MFRSLPLIALFSSLSTLTFAAPANNSTLDIQRCDGMTRGYAAAAPDAWGPHIIKGLVTSYYHWENPPIEQIPDSIDWTPMYWGSPKKSQWDKQQTYFSKYNVRQILGQNEIDVSSQANEDPTTAAHHWCAQLGKYQDQGIRISSPTAYDVNRLKAVAKEIKSYCNREWDFTAVHWYGSYNDLNGFKNAINVQRNAFPNNPVWVTEYATTQKGGGSYDQTKQFLTDATNWLESVGWVERAFYFGGYNTNPDGYANNFNKFFNDDGGLTDLGYKWVYN